MLVTNVDEGGDKADIAIFQNKEQAMKYWQAGLGERGFEQPTAEQNAPQPIKVARGVSHGKLYTYTSQPLNKPFDTKPPAERSASPDNSGAYQALVDEIQPSESNEPVSIASVAGRALQQRSDTNAENAITPGLKVGDEAV